MYRTALCPNGYCESAPIGAPVVPTLHVMLYRLRIRLTMIPRGDFRF